MTSLVVVNGAVEEGTPSPVILGGNGRILAIPEGEVETLDAGGRVVVPPFAEPHAHLDRAFSSAITGENRSGCLDEGVRLFKASLGVMTVEALVPGASRALGLLEAAGVGHVRTHTAIGGALGFRAWEAVEQAASTVPGVEVRQVAMPVDSNLHRPEVGSWLREAAGRGAVAVGGAPWRAEDPAKATRAAGLLAGEPGIGLDLQGIGIDNICDAVVAVGTGDPLRAAWLLAIGGHLTGEDDLEWLGRTVVAGNRRLCGLTEGLHPGDPGDVLLIDAGSLAEAVALVPARKRLSAEAEPRGG